MKRYLQSARYIIWIIFLGFSALTHGQSLLRESFVLADRFLDAPVVSKLPVGTSVQILKSDAGWTQIKVGQITGWIRASNLDGPVAEFSAVSQMQSGRQAKNNTLLASGIRGTSSQQADLDVETGPLTVPYLSRRFFIVEGERALYLSWLGGKPPFKLRLVRQVDGQEILLLTELHDRKILTPVIPLLVGDYALEIHDGERTTYEDLLKVVRSERLPKYPVTGLPPSQPEEKSAVFHATWLAGVESGRWIVEALQQLHKLSLSLPEAAHALSVIESGEQSESWE